jgi:antitoxin component YwqK of YwqJK toxin-antitoxin module
MDYGQRRAKNLASRFGKTKRVSKTGRVRGYFDSGRRAYEVEFVNGNFNGVCCFLNEHGDSFVELYLNL